jgi:DNA-binding GntR family transcriptional regulator
VIMRGSAVLVERAEPEASSTAHWVADALRERILAGELRPGSRLREVALAALLDVSRNSLREGLRLLSAEGLVTQVPNKGAAVSRLSIAAVHDIYRARRALEVQAATESATAGPGRFAAMEIAVADEERAEQARAWRTALTAGLRFHCALVAMLGSSRLDSFFWSLLAQLCLAWAEASKDDRLQRSWAERDRELYELLRTGRRSQGVGALLVYLADSEYQVLDVLRAVHPPATSRGASRPLLYGKQKETPW